MKTTNNKRLDLLVVGNLTNYSVLTWIGNQLYANDNDDEGGRLYNTGSRNMQFSYGVGSLRSDRSGAMTAELTLNRDNT